MGLAAMALAGVLAGWWATLAIRRVPKDEPVLRSWPRCGACDRYLAVGDLIPIVSWVLLRGRCRQCAARLGWHYPAVELLTGGLFVVLTWQLGLTVALLAYLYLAAVCVALFVIDAREHRLPDALTLPAYVVVAGLFTTSAALSGDWGRLGRAALAMVVLFVVYYVLAVVAAGALGFGDVKLAGLLGAAMGWLGWDVLIGGALLGFCFGGFYSLGLILARRATATTKIPFGPHIMLGALAAVLLHEHMSDCLELLVPAPV